MKKLLIQSVLLLLVVSSAFATDSQMGSQGDGQQMGQDKQSGQQGGKRRPPKEALDACKSKSSGDQCSFTGRSRTVSGTCFTPEESKPLACRPSGRN